MTGREIDSSTVVIPGGDRPAGRAAARRRLRTSADVIVEHDHAADPVLHPAV
jgi:hypothetical protein